MCPRPGTRRHRPRNAASPGPEARQASLRRITRTAATRTATVDPLTRANLPIPLELALLGPHRARRDHRRLVARAPRSPDWRIAFMAAAGAEPALGLPLATRQ